MDRAQHKNADAQQAKENEMFHGKKFEGLKNLYPLKLLQRMAHC
jgi:hypothetical protein